MDRPAIKIVYRFDSDDMSDDEYENQEEKTFIVTKQMLHDLMYEHVVCEPGETIDDVNFYVSIIK